MDFGWSDYEAKDYIEDDNDDDNFSSLSFESSYQPWSLVFLLF